MKLILILTIPLLVLSCRPAAAPVAISNQPIVNGVPQTNVPLPPRKPVNEMTWVTTDGQTAAFGSLAGKVVILDFWATYCPPCRDEIPHLNQIQAKYGTEKLQVIGLNVGGEDDRPKIPDFAKRYSISYPIAFPEDDLLEFVSGNDDRIPQTAVFDRNGKMITKIVGFDDNVKRQLDAAVETALSN